MSEKKWVINLTNIDTGIFRTMNGNAEEMIAVGRVIKAGFPLQYYKENWQILIDIANKQK